LKSYEEISELVYELGEDDELVYVTTIFPCRYSEMATLLLVESIRAFAKEMANFPIWCLKPVDTWELSRQAEERLHASGAEVIPYEIGEQRGVFFVPEVFAAEKAESMAFKDYNIMAWLGSNTVFVNEPKHFLLSEDKNLGYRPVHHTNIGSVYSGPLDEFWTHIYNFCAVPDESVFPMVTHVDGVTLRPYFNAGFIISRPEKRLMREWRRTFIGACYERFFREITKKDQLHNVFLHQAILSAMILAKYRREELQELPPDYNYPLHLYGDDSTGRRPIGLEELVTLRHEGFYKDEDWYEKMPAEKPLKDWIAKRVLK
jgi:hypothetical protein